MTLLSAQAGRVRFLSQVPALQGLPQLSLQELAAAGQEETYAPDTLIIAEGDPGTRFYIIMSGQAEVSCKSSLGPVILTTLNQGDLFGEIALLVPNTNRTASVKATTTVHVLSFSVEELKKLSENHPKFAQALQESARQIVVFNFLKRMSPLASLKADYLQQLAARLRVISVEAQRPIIKQGEKGRYCYILKSGSVDVVLHDAGGAERVVATLQPGAIFGEASLLTNATRNAAVVSREPCELLAMSRQDLLDAIESDQVIAMRMMELLQLRDRPRRKQGVTEQEIRQDERGLAVVLKDAERGVYYRLTPEGKFLWDLLDGNRSIRDLTIAYFKTFKSFSPQAIAEVVGGLGQAGFLESVTWSERVQKLLVRLPWTQKVVAKIFSTMEWTTMLRHVDGGFSRAYQRGIKFLYTLPAQVVLAGIALCGGVLFAYLSLQIQINLQIVKWLPTLLLLLPALLLSIVVHELGHAFTVKAFGREVMGVGVGWYWFSPIAFVDTSDMWLAPRWPQIAVSLAGPYTHLILAGLVLGGAWLSGNAAVIQFTWFFALVSYALVLINLNPLMEYDGYYILMDWLKRPNLRSRSLGWLLRDFPKALFQPRLLRGHGVDLVYGLGSIAYGVGVIVSLAWLIQKFWTPLF